MAKDEKEGEIRHLSVLVEHVISQNDAVLEAVGDIQGKVKNLPTREEFNELKDDVKIVKAAVTDLSHQVNKHEKRLTHLVSAA